MRLIAKLLACLGSIVLAQSAAAQTYPTRPITLIVPSSAGGSVDMLNRLVAEKASTILGQPIVLEFRPGGGGMIGASAVARAEPDGYTIGFLGTGVVAGQGLGKKLNFDVRDYVPVGHFFNLRVGLIVKPTLEAKTLADFVALAKTKPGQLNFGSSGYGGAPHIATEIFMQATGTKITHIPYPSDATALQDTISGQVDVYITGASVAVPHHQAGRLRMLGITGATRLETIPDVPTFQESGFEKAEYLSWNSWVLPPRTPPQISRVVSAALLEAAKDDRIRKRFAEVGVDLVSIGPEQLGKTIRDTVERYQELAKTANIKFP